MSERVYDLPGGGRITIIRIEDDEPAPALAPPQHVQPVTAQPGSQWAAAAARQGREDEYIDAMRSRFGGEW